MMALTASINSKRRYTAEDFLPKWEIPVEQVDPSTPVELRAPEDRPITDAAKRLISLLPRKPQKKPSR